MRGERLRRLRPRPALLVALVAALVLAQSLAARGEGIQAAISGREELVFDWSRDACHPEDYPDLPARAFRDVHGRVQLIVSHHVNRRLIGPDLDHLAHPCAAVMTSSRDPDPAQFNDREWIAALHTLNGADIVALVHNEYQGHRHPGRCPSGRYAPCWYNALTSARSLDGGRTYIQRPPPRHLVASVPYRYSPGRGPYGLLSPSNIVRHPRNGLYYAALFAAGFGRQARGTCLMRSPDPFVPGSWRAWDGQAFRVAFVDPYRRPVARPDGHVCRPLPRRRVQEMHGSLTWSTYLERFVLVGTAKLPVGRERRPSWGVAFSTSDNLVDWTPARLIRPITPPWAHRCGQRNAIAYPTLLDPSSRSRTFDTIGRTAHLYFTRQHYEGCRQTPNRDLVRVPVRFSK
jgi:hypothetical protein